ncbi:hypothetical protein AAC387_Pa03g4354 [Persea americana]
MRVTAHVTAQHVAPPTAFGSRFFQLPTCVESDSPGFLPTMPPDFLQLGPARNPNVLIGGFYLVVIFERFECVKAWKQDTTPLSVLRRPRRERRRPIRNRC